MARFAKRKNCEPIEIFALGVFVPSNLRYLRSAVVRAIPATAVISCQAKPSWNFNLPSAVFKKIAPVVPVPGFATPAATARP